MNRVNAVGAELFKCTTCRGWAAADGYEVDKHGVQRRSCLRCKTKREANKCQHGRRRSTCKDCGGSEICPHKRRRQICSECFGASLCEHGRQSANCRECGGASICEHNRRRCRCILCGGSSICEHKRLRADCVTCDGSAICEHKRHRRYCAVCDPAGHLRQLVASRIQDALKSDKERGSLEYLGCPIDDFKQHIEGTFEAGMSWENHGMIVGDGPRTWNIDHVIPIKYPGADGGPPSLEEVAARLHWTNTKAMWADENIAKGNRFVDAPQVVVPMPQLTDDDITELLDDLLRV